MAYRSCLSVKRFEEALQRYFAGDFAEAQSGFEPVLQGYPSDKAAAPYALRTVQCMTEGVPEAWDGIEVMGHK